MGRVETQVEELPENRVRLTVEVPQDAVRHAVDHLAPAERPVQVGDTVVVDLVSASGEAQRDYVVEVGSGRLVEEIERALVGMTAGETKTVGYELADDS